MPTASLSLLLSPSFKEKLKGRRPLGKSERKWDNIKMELKGIGCGDIDSVDMVRDTV
jgi:hypothetical protein